MLAFNELLAPAMPEVVSANMRSRAALHPCPLYPNRSYG
ncbi:hypothetical protein ABID59_001194 [Bradyrhizobium sp. S3.3.6]